MAQVRTMWTPLVLPMQGDAGNAHHTDAPVTRTGTHNSHTHSFLSDNLAFNDRKCLIIGLSRII